MKFLPSQLAYLWREPDSRKNVLELLRYVLFTAVVMAVYTVVFHLLMLNVEGKTYSWVTGFYWTLTVMTTLGFGDITFDSDIGRFFSIAVLLTGLVLLLIVMPFAFIRLFFAPWLEAQVRLAAPRSVPPGTVGHVLIAAWDAIAPGLARRLDRHDISHFVLEPDPLRAAQLYAQKVSVVTGEIDAEETYEQLDACQARLFLANREDTINTNMILTTRAVAPDLPIVATASEDDSVDILELSGGSQIIALKRLLGEMLVHRVDTGHARSHVVGRFHDLVMAEFGVEKTGFVGKTLAATRLGETLGVNVIGLWGRGELLPVTAESVLDEGSAVVVLGRPEQIERLDVLVTESDTKGKSALIIGGGKVGLAAAREFRRREFPVNLVEKDPDVAARLTGEVDLVVVGDAADREVLLRAGIAEAPAVLVTTADDAVNIYLSIYCRRLNPGLRILSRITHERNVAAIYRAGADFVLSYASLGVEHVMASLRGAELVLLGEKVELFSLPVPSALNGRTLAQSGLRQESGLNVIAMRIGGELVTHLDAATTLSSRAELVVLCSHDQRLAFEHRYRPD